MVGKTSFALGIVVFLAATFAVVTQGSFHTGLLSFLSESCVREYVEADRGIWLPGAFALGFALVGLGVLLIFRKDKPK